MGIFLVPLFLYSMAVSAGNFESLSLQDWKKEEIAVNHLRFSLEDTKKSSVNVKVDGFPATQRPSQENLKFYMEKMGELRRKTFSAFGMDDWKVTSYELDNKEPKVLKIRGQYKSILGKVISFEEWNVYFKSQFIQATFTQRDATFDQELSNSVLEKFKFKEVEVE